jgi:DNA topoisomerase-1
VLAVIALNAIGPFANKTQSKMNLRRAFEAVGRRLGNTPTICRTCYVHPEVVTCYLEGALPKVQAGERNGGRSSRLPKDERLVLRLLERRLAPTRRRSPRRASVQVPAAQVA